MGDLVLSAQKRIIGRHHAILDALRTFNGPMSTRTLAMTLQRDTTSLLVDLNTMEIRGQVHRLPSSPMSIAKNAQWRWALGRAGS